jgi:hypothetical protein
VSATTTAAGTPAAARPVSARRTVARQSGVVGAQLAAGVGNLGFAVVAVRWLPGGEYAQLAAFLAAYLLINTPAASLTAGASLRPDLAARMRPVALAAGCAVGVLLAVSAPWLATFARLPMALVVLLAVDAPVAGVLALARGHLFGQHRLGAAATAIVTEPAVRCAVGLALLPLAGTTGAAVGVVAGGYAAFGACLLLRRAVPRAETGTARGAAPATVLSFLLLATLGAQDVIVANRILPRGQAGLFAATSTLGGAVLFASATVPLVALAQLRSHHRHALRAALGISLLTSVGASAVLLLLPARLFTAVLGPVGARLGSVLPAYLGAMTLLCLARVLLAALCANGRGRQAGVAAAVAVVVQVALLLRADSAAGAALATTVGAGVLLSAVAVLFVRSPRRPTRAVPQAAVSSAAPTDVAAAATAPAAAPAGTQPAAGPAHLLAQPVRWWRRADLLWVLGCCVLAVGVRLATDRSVWIDEAISVHEASQSYGQMLHLLRTTDVHPPLYFTLLWAVIHGTGSTAELIVRIPSVVPGVLLVAVAFYAARDVWDRRTARFAAVVATIGPAAVWYSQDARMYALFMLFGTVGAWALVRVLRTGRWRDVAVLVASCAALLWTQYDTVLVVGTLLAILIGVALRRGLHERAWGLLLRAGVASTAVVLSFVPLIGWVIQQYGHTSGLSASLPAQAGQGTAGGTPTGLSAYSALANAVWAVAGYHSDHAMVLINAFWPLLILLVLASLGRGTSTAGRVFGAVAIVPPLVLFIAATRRSDLFDLRYFAATVPMLNLLIARLAATWGRRRFTRVAIPLLLTVALGAGLIDEQVNRSNPRVYDFRSAVAFVRGHSRPGDLLLYGPTFLTSELDYYQPGITTKPITGVPQTENNARVFVLGSFLNKKAPAGQVGTAVSSLKQNRHLVRKVKFPNVTVWEFD